MNKCKRKLERKNLYLVVAAISILFLYTFNVTSSRYMGQLESDNDVIAIPILNLSNNEMVYNVDKMLPGDVRDIEFSVSNKEDSKINEILLEYAFEFTVGNELPLKIKLFDVTDNTEIDITDSVSDTERLDFGTESIKNYKLQITWDENDNDIKYANKATTIQVKLRAIQVI